MNDAINAGISRLAEKLLRIVKQMETTGDWRLSEAEAVTITDASKMLAALSTPSAPVEPTPAQVEWLEDAARYFEARPTLGEDMAHWANVHNAEMCRKIAGRLAALRPEPSAALALSPATEVRREAIALAARLEQVAKVMRSARTKSIPMEVWADDLKAVEDAILALPCRADEREKQREIDYQIAEDLSISVAVAIRESGGAR